MLLEEGTAWVKDSLSRGAQAGEPHSPGGGEPELSGVGVFTSEQDSEELEQNP